MEDGDGNIVHGQWREESAPQGLEPIRRLGGNRHPLLLQQLGILSGTSSVLQLEK